MDQQRINNQAQPTSRSSALPPTALRPEREMNRAASSDGLMSRRKPMMIAALIVILLILGIAGMFVRDSLSSAQNSVETDKFQAVFLTNGQVYFGKLTDVDGSYSNLTQVYYLQVQQQVQPKDNSATQQPQVSLTKLGSELHGPEDNMHIAHAQILFWENLKSDGKVAQAIAQYQKSQAK